MPCTKDLDVDTSKPVLVTGATGYVAGVLILHLLERGIQVHATVRDPSKKDRLQYLQDLCDGSKGSLTFFGADLMQEGSFDEAMKGCSIVFHTASPFAVDVKDPVKDLIDPAVQGTKNVLGSAKRTPSVKRVVLTSSIAAIYTDACESTAEKPLNESTWNRVASVDYQPYSLSKTAAEMEAWVIAGGQTQWELVVINPSMVFGPGAKFHESSTSYTMFQTVLEAPALPKMGLGMVDVRDVADAHIAAAYLPNAHGRHILSGSEPTTLYSLAEALSPNYPAYKISTYVAPKTLLLLFGLGIGRTYTWRNVNVDVHVDNTKSIQELGIQYRPLEETARDMMEQFIKLGKIAPTRK